MNGKVDGSGTAINKELSLENSSDLFVGGTPSGRNFKGTFEFYGSVWEPLQMPKPILTNSTHGSFPVRSKDFTGSEPVGKRDAGALERK